jgi:hypothetical protein
MRCAAGGQAEARKELERLRVERLVLKGDSESGFAALIALNQELQERVDGLERLLAAERHNVQQAAVMQAHTKAASLGATEEVYHEMQARRAVEVRARAIDSGYLGDRAIVGLS